MPTPRPAVLKLLAAAPLAMAATLLASDAALAGGSIYQGWDEAGVLTFTDSPTGPDFEILIEVKKDRPKEMAAINASILKKNIDLYDNEIVEESLRADVSPELVKAMVLVESGFNPRARSPKGAMGLMQLMPFTAREVGVTDAYDPRQSIRGGVTYLRKMLDRFGGDTRLAVAAYNAGPGRVEKAGGIPAIAETRFYVDRVFRYSRYFAHERPIASR